MPLCNFKNIKNTQNNDNEYYVVILLLFHILFNSKIQIKNI